MPADIYMDTVLGDGFDDRFILVAYGRKAGNLANPVRYVACSIIQLYSIISHIVAKFQLKNTPNVLLYCVLFRIYGFVYFCSTHSPFTPIKDTEIA